MAEANEPKKETVRITLPPRRGDTAAPEDDDTVRINIPSRPPTSEPPPISAPLVPKTGNVPIPRPPVAQNPLPAPRSVLPPPPPAAAAPPPLPPVAKTPLPRPSGTTAAASAPMPAPRPVPATTPLSKETARISVLPDPPKPASAPYRDSHARCATDCARDHRPCSPTAGPQCHPNAALLGIGIGVSRHFDH